MVERLDLTPLSPIPVHVRLLFRGQRLQRSAAEPVLPAADASALLKDCDTRGSGGDGRLPVQPTSFGDQRGGARVDGGVVRSIV